ncbi:MAG: MarR family winged helix-turn-helix transcriptional regulator, partial [Gemmatimonadales bacterium]
PGELAAALGLTTGSVTAMLDRLERRGYVSRMSDPADRRRVQVRPSTAATRAADRLWGPLANAGRVLMARYTSAELEVVLDVLRRAREIQEAHTRRIRGQGRGRGRGRAKPR